MNLLNLNTFVYILDQDEIHRTYIKEIKIVKDDIYYKLDGFSKWHSQEKIYTSLNNLINFLKYKAIEKEIINRAYDLKMGSHLIEIMERIQNYVKNITNIDIKKMSNYYKNNPKFNDVWILLINEIVTIIENDTNRNNENYKDILFYKIEELIYSSIKNKELSISIDKNFKNIKKLIKLMTKCLKTKSSRFYFVKEENV